MICFHFLSPQTQQIMLTQLDDLRNLVRQDISRIGRMTLSALIVIEVHARDVVAKMVDEEVSNPNDFEWISQLRYDTILYSTFLYGCISLPVVRQQRYLCCYLNIHLFPLQLLKLIPNNHIPPSLDRGWCRWSDLFS